MENHVTDHPDNSFEREHRSLLLEIGTEEIPARFCQPALDQLKANAEKALSGARLDYAEAGVYGTPRRLVLSVQGLAGSQRDREVVQKGPSKKVAFDAADQPTIPAQKFAQSQEIRVEDLEVRQDEKGVEYIFARRQEKGQRVEEVLPPLLARLVLSIEWPKAMRWADRSIRYVRPIKWLLALLGTSTVAFDIDGIPVGNFTFGHRVLGPASPIHVGSAGEYFARVAAGAVIVDHHQRQQLIWEQIEAEASHLGGHVQPDERLLEEITWLVEQPNAFSGSFAAAFLEVPPLVLVTTMKANQRYFPVYRAEGSSELLPYFIAVQNGDPQFASIVRAGNEKVLAARFADARFFWDEDRKHPLSTFNEKLKGMVFQEKLGTQMQRVERLTALAGIIALALDLSAEEREQAVTAASLCKADLATKMVFEFPEVQGYMGQQYLLREGGLSSVAEAIYEHYLPRGAGDDIPHTKPGITVALADKIDTLVGYFSLGEIPSGSKDPFALRRAAQGIVQTILERAITLDLAGQLISPALDQYHLDPATAQKVKSDLLEFFKARLRVLMESRNLRYDVIDAVLAGGLVDPGDTMKRAEILAVMLNEADFAAVTGTFKRVSNLARKATEEGVQPGEVAATLFTEAAEQELYRAFLDLFPALQMALEKKDYTQFYHLATRLKPPVDAFLDTVRVNVADHTLKTNRYSLLIAVGNLLSTPADLGRLAG